MNKFKGQKQRAVSIIKKRGSVQTGRGGADQIQIGMKTYEQLGTLGTIRKRGNGWWAH